VPGVQLVTRSAGNVATGVGAVLPVQAPGVSLVAGEADPVLGIGRHGFRAWIDDAADAPATAFLGVFECAVAMTNEAGAAIRRCAGIGFYTVPGANVGVMFLNVTGLADFRICSLRPRKPG